MGDLGWDVLIPFCTGDPDHDEMITAFTVLDANLHNADGPIMVVVGIGHDTAELIAFATFTDELGGWRPYQGMRPELNVEPGRWAWSNRLKHCDRITGGAHCDDEGEWHRHLVEKPGGIELTLLSLASYTGRFTMPVDALTHLAELNPSTHTN
jgi:hypothetical protein